MKWALGILVFFMIFYGIYSSKKVCREYICRQCKKNYGINVFEFLFSVQKRSGEKYLKCPHCGKRAWTTPTIPKDKNWFARLRW